MSTWFISSSYFKPAPRWDEKARTLHLPKSCPLQKIVVEGNINSRIVKQTACLEACKKLHEIGALTDNLVPDIVVEEGTGQECGNFLCCSLLFRPALIVYHFILAIFFIT
jgi:endoribonuclease Dicer